MVGLNIVTGKLFHYLYNQLQSKAISVDVKVRIHRGGNLRRSSTSADCKCLNFRLKFSYRVKFYPTSFRQQDLARNL